MSNTDGTTPNIGHVLAPEKISVLSFLRALNPVLCAQLRRSPIPDTPNSMRLAVLLYPEAYKKLREPELMPAASP